MEKSRIVLLLQAHVCVCVCQKTRLVLGENININGNSRPASAQQTVSSKLQIPYTQVPILPDKYKGNNLGPQRVAGQLKITAD